MNVKRFKTTALLFLLCIGISITKVKAEGNPQNTADFSRSSVTITTIYRTDKDRNIQLKYEYTYHNHKLMSKEAFWENKKRREWLPYYKFNYAYKENEVIILYGVWNQDKRDYDKKREKKIFKFNDDNQITASEFYKWDKKGNCWKQTNQPLDYTYR